uniref:translation initiation factor IF-2-like n=1 Tax=Nyctereutes procyonoides TaxID=34880 RepID=UPI002443C789|nr:translation initiation factor IF-2-like [Nyctereutes procyonoides]
MNRSLHGIENAHARARAHPLLGQEIMRQNPGYSAGLFRSRPFRGEGNFSLQRNTTEKHPRWSRSRSKGSPAAPGGEEEEHRGDAGGGRPRSSPQPLERAAAPPPQKPAHLPTGAAGGPERRSREAREPGSAGARRPGAPAPRVRQQAPV